MPGAVATTHGWGQEGAAGMRIASERPGFDVYHLLPCGSGSVDPLSTMGYMTGIPVDLELLAASPEVAAEE